MEPYLEIDEKEWEYIKTTFEKQDVRESLAKVAMTYEIPYAEISKKDAFKQYLAYHEGWGNFKNYKQNEKVIKLAKKVEKQSNLYKKQLLECKNSLNKNKYIIF